MGRGSGNSNPRAVLLSGKRFGRKPVATIIPPGFSDTIRGFVEHMKAKGYPESHQKLLDEVSQYSEEEYALLNEYVTDDLAWLRGHENPEYMETMAYALKDLCLWSETWLYRSNEIGQVVRKIRFENDECRRTSGQTENNENDYIPRDFLDYPTAPGIGTVLLGGKEYNYDVLDRIYQVSKSRFSLEVNTFTKELAAHMLDYDFQFEEEDVEKYLDALDEGGYLDKSRDAYLIMEHFGERVPYFLMPDVATI